MFNPSVCQELRYNVGNISESVRMIDTKNGGDADYIFSSESKIQTAGTQYPVHGKEDVLLG